MKTLLVCSLLSAGLAACDNRHEPVQTASDYSVSSNSLQNTGDSAGTADSSAGRTLPDQMIPNNTGPVTDMSTTPKPGKAAEKKPKRNSW